MKSNFPRALKAVLVHEGGYVNHPKDPGGETNKGVTKAVYETYRRRKGLPIRSVAAISDAEVSDIYKTQYWDKVNGDGLPSGLDYAVFDFAVNSGVKRAKDYLARINVTGTANKINELCDLRLAFLKRLKTWPTFGKGWNSRVASVRLKALAWAKDAPAKLPVAPPVSVSHPKPVTPSKPQNVNPVPSVGREKPAPAKERGLLAAIAAALGLGGVSGASGLTVAEAIPLVLIAAVIIGVAVWFFMKGK